MRTLAGKVRLVDKIARGGMGDVYRAQNIATGGEVAVKVLEAAALADEDMRDRFRHEARVSAILTHPSIVRVFDLLEEEDGTLALVMELLRGETLEERLTKSPLAVDVAVATMVPILAALSHAHAVGIVHRDVKPANVFLAVEPDGRIVPKLLDFGVAKTQAAAVHTMDGKVLGTARYMSPEQVRGETLDARSDVWSAAAVLYEAITGRCPFEACDAPAAIAKVLEAAVDPDERIPTRLWLSIERALSKQSYARPDSASAFSGELLASLSVTEDELPRLAADALPPLPRLETRGALKPVVVVPDAPPSAGRSRNLGAWAVAAAFASGAIVTAAVVLGARTREPDVHGGGPQATTPAISAATASTSEVRTEPAPASSPSTALSARASAATQETRPAGATGGHKIRAGAATRDGTVATTPGF